MDQLLAGYASDSSADNNDGSESQIDGANLSKEINVSSSKRKVEGERRLNADPKRPRAEAQSPAADQERATASATQKDRPPARATHNRNGNAAAALQRRPAARLPDPTALLAAASGDDLHGLLAPVRATATAAAVAGAAGAAVAGAAALKPTAAASVAAVSNPASAQPPPQLPTSQIQNQIQIQAPDPYGGRLRRFPHVVGNYATVVMLPVQGLALEGALDALYRKLRRLIPDLEPVTKPQEPAAAAGGSGGGGRGGGRESSPACNGGYHISLSRSVPITRAQIEPLTTQLAARLEAAGIGAFPLTLCGLRTFANDEGSRSFVSAMVATGEREVVGLVRAVDGAFEAHGLPPFYQEPLPHVSVGWLVGDQRPRIQAALDRFTRQQQAAAQQAVAQAKARAQSSQATTALLVAAAAEGAARATQPAAGSQHGAAAAAGAASAFSLGPWQASRAVCIVGQREYEVWRPAAAAAAATAATPPAAGAAGAAPGGRVCRPACGGPSDWRWR